MVEDSRCSDDYLMWLPVPGVPVSTSYVSNVFSQLND